MLQEVVTLVTELPERHSDIRFYHFMSVADTPRGLLFRMCSDARDIVQQLKPPMREIDCSVFQDIKDSCTDVFPEIKHLI